MGWGQRVFGLGVIAMGVVRIALGGFPAGAVPAGLPGRAALGYAAAALMLVAGAGLQWRRTAMGSAIAIVAYFGVFDLGLIEAPAVARHAGEYVAWFGVAEPLATVAGGVIVLAAVAPLPAAMAQRLTRAAQIAFGACAVYFGGAHFAYLRDTVAFVPKWLPPSQVFWAYVTGVAHIAGGLALISGIQARLAAILLTVMYASFTPLVHIPMFLANHHSHRNWMENATNIVLTGVAWLVAEALARSRFRPARAGP